MPFVIHYKRRMTKNGLAFDWLAKEDLLSFILGSIAVIMYIEVYCDYIVMGMFSQYAGLVSCCCVIESISVFAVKKLQDCEDFRNLRVLVR